MVGGDHATGAGGFSAGAGDTCEAGYNGYGSFNNTREYAYGTSGGYYTIGTGLQFVDVFFNQGGMWQGINRLESANNDTYKWYHDYSGSGGASGEGGNVYYYDLEKIHAYNGDRITNDDYDTVIYEYEADGTVTDKVAKVLTKLNNEKFVQTKIFAQEGIIRATYKTNQAMTQEECKLYNVTYVVQENATTSQTKNVKITEQTTTPTTEYGQGIGSGAGYLEKSNGILKPISEYGK